VGAQVLAVAGHYALRASGGAGGEQQIGEVVWRDGLRRRSCVVFGDGRGARQEIRPGGAALGVAAQQHDLFEIRQVFARERVGVVRAEELAHRTQDAGAALAQHGSRLGALKARVQRNQHGPGRLQADGREDPLVEVGRPDRDAVAAGDAGGAKGTRGVQPLLRQLREAQRDVAVLDRVPAREARSGGLHQARDRAQVRRLLPFLHTSRTVS
jgi:hypothetical protein